MEAHADNVLFNQLYKENVTRLFYIAYNAFHEYHTAEDLVQDTFLAYLFNTEKLRSHPNKPGWLAKTLFYKIGKEAAKAKRRREVPLLDHMEIPISDRYVFLLADSFPAELRKGDREILTLYYEKELKYEEIAQQLGISSNNVAIRLHRARQRFKELYEKKNGVF